MNYAEQENWFQVRDEFFPLPGEWRDDAVMYWRDGWDAPQAFRMDEQDALFDVDGLYYFGGFTRLIMAASTIMSASTGRVQGGSTAVAIYDNSRGAGHYSTAQARGANLAHLTGWTSHWP